jgi:glycosyltransferase involved in cell wall biosynthesis
MFKSKDFFVVGNFGFLSKDLDGQNIKTREIHELFVQKLEGNVRYFDTDQLKKQKISILKFFIHIRRIKILIYLPGLNNLKFFSPLLYILSRLFNFKIHYFVVGGWLPDFISVSPYYKLNLSKIDCIYVETNEMLKRLTNGQKLNNVKWFPNFRVDHQAKRTSEQSQILKLVFFSRIRLDKGVDTIFSYLDSILNTPVYNKLTIDFYGAIDPPIANWFSTQIKKHSNSCFRGTVAPESVQATLCNYDFMLFPSRYKGEGCAGVIIDAFMASVPVLASDWNFNKEFVKDGYNGYLINHDNIEQMAKIIVSLINKRDLILELGKNAKEFSEKFTRDKAWEMIKLDY